MEITVAQYKKYMAWLASRDTGVSSETMLYIHCGARASRLDAPYDPADFGRCYRLVKKFPEIKQSFPKIGRRVSAFKKILGKWDDLCELYEQELKNPDGRAPLIYAEIKRLRGDRD